MRVVTTLLLLVTTTEAGWGDLFRTGVNGVVRASDDITRAAAATAAKTKTVSTSADDIIKWTARTATEAKLKRVDKFLTTLAKASTDIPEAVLPILDDIGYIPMDIVFTKAIGEAMSRSAAAAANGIKSNLADKRFWLEILPHLKHLRAAKKLERLTKTARKGMREFEPEELIEIQRMSDNYMDEMLHIVDEAAEAGSHALDILVRRSAGEIFDVAKDKVSETVTNYYTTFKKNLKKPRGLDDHDMPEVQFGVTAVAAATDTAADTRLIVAEMSFEEATLEMKLSISGSSPPQELSQRLATQINKGELLKDAVDDMVDVAFKRAIEVDAKYLLEKGLRPSRKLTKPQKVAVIGSGAVVGAGGVGGGTAAAVLVGGGQAAASVTSVVSKVIREGGGGSSSISTVTSAAVGNLDNSDKSLAAAVATNETPKMFQTWDYRDHPRSSSYGFGMAALTSDEYLDRDYGWSSEDEEEEETTTTVVEEETTLPPYKSPQEEETAPTLPQVVDFYNTPVGLLLFPTPVQALLWPKEENATEEQQLLLPSNEEIEQVPTPAAFLSLLPPLPISRIFPEVDLLDQFIEDHFGEDGEFQVKHKCPHYFSFLPKIAFISLLAPETVLFIYFSDGSNLVIRDRDHRAEDRR